MKSKLCSRIICITACLIIGGSLKAFSFDRHSNSENSILNSPLKSSYSKNIKEVSGKVTDEEGKAISGVTVSVKGTSVGTTTDKRGNFSLQVELNQKIVFSFIGYKTEEVPYIGQISIDVVLKVSSTLLDEVVMVGYGTVKKKDQTGAIVTIKGNDLNKTNTFSVNNLLEGKVAGATFRTNSAQPGGAAWVNIRGALSPTGSNYPLYVIDGIPITTNYSLNPSLNGLGYGGGVDRDPLNTLNPNDIESITVLKDASATAIYGSNAANGVILITTKHGEDGKIKVEYNGYYTVTTPKKSLDLLDAKDFMKLNNSWGHELWLKNNGIAPYGNTDSSQVAPYISKFSPQQITNAGAGTDWLDVVMRKTGYTMGHNISISGGSKKTLVYSSFNIMKNDGILKHSSLERYSGRFNITQEVSNHVTFISSLLLSQVKADNASVGSSSGGGEMWPMLLTAIYFPPTIGIRDSTTGNFMKGYFPNMYNPAAFLIMTDNTITNRMLFAPKLNLKILNSLSATISGGIDMQTTTRKYFLPVAAQSFLYPNGQGQISNVKQNNSNLEGYLTYTKKFKNNHLTAVLGAGYYNTNGSGDNMVGYGYFTDNFGVDNIGIANNNDKNSFGSYRTQINKLSAFSRVDYSFKDRYSLTATARRDGASFFAQNEKWGFFPGIAAAWRINEESFLSNVNWLSNLKLRLGYGESGNASIIGNHQLSLYQSRGDLRYVIGGNTYTGIIQTQIGNPNLKWETDISINLGLDFGFWDNRLQGSIDLYSRTAKDLLDFEPLPSNNPVTSIAANIGSTRSKGIDFSLNSKNIVGHKFTWSSNITLSSYKVFWVERNPMVSLPEYIGKNDPLHAFYGWRTDGIILSSKDKPPYMPDAHRGNIKYIDLNKDGKLDIKDVTYLGNADPKATFGFGNTFAYSSFDLSFYFYGFIGYPLWNGYQYYASPNNLAGVQSINTDSQVRDAWATFNPAGTQPGIADDNYSGNNPAGTDFGMEDASFLRLKNIMLGYTLPSNIIKRIGINNLRFYLNVQNLWLFTKYKGIDPEMSAYYDPYPTTRGASFGVNVTF